MGLDMYLYAERYISGYSFSGEDERTSYRAVLEAAELGDLVDEDSPSAEVKATVLYWRKENAIHQWFVDNVQDGVDDCRPYDVSRDQLIELRDLCKKVLETAKLTDGTVTTGIVYTAENPAGKALVEEGQVIANPEEVAELLPTQSGFFFGGTDYDSWYLEGVQRTAQRLDLILEKTEGQEWAKYGFSYRSSW